MSTVSLHDVEAQAATFRDCFIHLREQIGRVFVGQPTLVEHLLLCFFCQGHALLEGPPGLGKTLLIRTLSDAVGLTFARIQCTPDLMPADVTGTNILAESPDGLREFAFQPGPIFANVVLADEINRATPRTQSAFLEAMQERRVTVFGVAHPIEEPFSVFATQNPIDMEGTYPLPEAQLDRFFFKLAVQTPTLDELSEIMERTTGEAPPPVEARFGRETIRALLPLVRQVRISGDVMRFVLRIVRGTHPEADEAPDAVKKYVRYGASPRGAQSIVLASKALALLSGRYHVAAEDVLRVVRPALGHRLILNFQGEMEHVSTTTLVDQAVAAAGGGHAGR